MNDETMRRDVAPKFGDKFLNTVAGDSNPRKIGMFVRVIHRAHGRMNPGKWWQMTDGKGDFWESNPDNLVPVDDAIDQASAPEGEAVAEVYEYPREHSVYNSPMLKGVRFIGASPPVGTKLYTRSDAKAGELVSHALRFAAMVVELYDDATMRDDHMIASGDCADILNALAERPEIFLSTHDKTKA